MLIAIQQFILKMCAIASAVITFLLIDSMITGSLTGLFAISLVFIAGIITFVLGAFSLRKVSSKKHTKVPAHCRTTSTIEKGSLYLHTNDLQKRSA